MLGAHLKEILHSLASLLKSKNQSKIGSIYAINSGKYIGEFFVLVEKTSTEYRFLSLPKMLIRSVPFDDMNRGLKNKIISFIKILPTSIFQICWKQYHHGLKQSKIVDKELVPTK